MANRQIGQFRKMGDVQKVLKIILIGIKDGKMGKVWGRKIQNLD